MYKKVKENLPARVQKLVKWCLCICSSENQTEFLKYQKSFRGSVNYILQSAVYNNGEEDVLTFSNTLVLIYVMHPEKNFITSVQTDRR